MGDEQISIIDGGDYYDITSTLNNGTTISIRILEDKKMWRWFYLVRTENLEHAILKDEKIWLHREQKGLTSILIKEVNEGFYTMFGYLKKHPSYRLKIMNLLDDEERKVWNLV